MRNLITNVILNFDRSFSGKSRNQIAWLISGTLIVIGILYATALLLNIQTPDMNGDQQEDNLLRFIITQFLDPGTVNKSLLADRWYAIVTSMCGITLFSGILISVISNILERRVERYRTGDIRYNLSNHIVIIGFDNATPSLVTQICSNPQYKRKHILVQSVEPTEIIRDKLSERLTDRDEKRIVIFHARRDSLEELELLNTHKCAEIFIIGETDECEHDFINIDCLKLLTAIHAKKRCKSTPVPTTVLFNEESTFAILQLNDISRQWRAFFSFRPINYQQEWAKRLIVSQKYICNGKPEAYPSLYGEGIPFDSDIQVHLVIIGMDRMATALAIEAAHTMHFPNFCRDKKLKTRVTFIAPNAIDESTKFIQHHRHFFEIAPYYIQDFINQDGKREQVSLLSREEQTENDFLDIEFTFINGQAESEGIRKLLKQWSTDATQRVSIAICQHDSNKSIDTGLHLPDTIYLQHIPIFIYQHASSALLNIVRESTNTDRWNKYAHVYPFGMYENNFNIDKKELYAAQCSNYIYHYFDKYQQLPSSIAPNEELSCLWEQKEVALQWSNYYHAHAIAPKLRALQIHDYENLSLTEEQIDLLAEIEHNRWNVEKLLLGYRKPTDKELNTLDRATLKQHFIHPDIKPYHKLSEGTKDYNRAIANGLPLTVKAIMKM